LAHDADFEVRAEQSMLVLPCPVLGDPKSKQQSKKSTPFAKRTSLPLHFLLAQLPQIAPTLDTKMFEWDQLAYSVQSRASSFSNNHLEQSHQASYSG
jgi:hypothetical protein